MFSLSTWSAHQYQIDEAVAPKINPGQGMSPSTGSRSNVNASALGYPQVVFGIELFGIAVMYCSRKPEYPPTLIKP